MEYYIAANNVKAKYQAKPKPADYPQDLHEKKAAMYRDLYESIQFFDDLFLEALQDVHKYSGIKKDRKYL